MPLPNAIDHHACRQRIPFVRYPCGQSFPSIAIYCIGGDVEQGGNRTYRGNGSWKDFMLRCIDIPAGEEKCRFGLGRCCCIDAVGCYCAGLCPASRFEQIIERLPRRYELCVTCCVAWFNQTTRRRRAVCGIHFGCSQCSVIKPCFINSALKVGIGSIVAKSKDCLPAIRVEALRRS